MYCSVESGAIGEFIGGVNPHMVVRPHFHSSVFNAQNIACIGPFAVSIRIPAGVVLLRVFCGVEDAQLGLSDVYAVDLTVTRGVARAVRASIGAGLSGNGTRGNQD
jgi:hypothetical protein